ncbi:MAG: acetylxylan esterase [Armatimonadetes bacterium]|nr:acetylxylan esterase [Armatimonadota bacterium]
MTPAAATAEEQAQAAKVLAAGNVAPEDPVGPMWDLDALSKAPQTWPAEGFTSATEGIRAVYYEGLPWHGKPTRVFAWIGLPKVEPGRKVPGIVLVHGGGGTAFDTWVKLWTSRGYAAISMDTCGCVPKGTYGNWERNPQGGPPGWGGYGQIDQPREDQWTHHAVADAVLADSLLRSLPEVDAERIGVTGISWGGYLCSIIAGVDDRFKFAVPVYGCGFTRDHAFAGSVNGLGKERGDRWMRWWDPSVYLRDARMPMLWVTGTNDFAYWFPALQKSYRLPPGPRTLAVRLRMPHGHGPAGEGPEEIHAFADSIVNGGDRLPLITHQGRSGSTAWCTFRSKVPVVKAELLYTKGKQPNWPDRPWEAVAAKVEGGKVTVELPEGVTVWFINLIDERGLVLSTEDEEM